MASSLKRCKDCGQEFPSTIEFFPKGHKLKNGDYGLKAVCHSCNRQRKRAEYRRNKQRYHDRDRHYYQTHREQVKRTVRRYREDHPDIVKARNSAWQKRNPDKRRAASQRYKDRDREAYNLKRRAAAKRRRDKNPDKYRTKDREQGRKWRAKHPGYKPPSYGKWKAENPEATRDIKRNWKQRNPLYSRIDRARRRTRQYSLPCHWSRQDWLSCLDYWEQRCCVCGQTDDQWYRIAQDHWIPVSNRHSDNPGTVPWNIVPLCASKKDSPTNKVGCNNSKSNKEPLIWLIERFGEAEAARILERIEAYFAYVRMMKQGED